MYAQNSILCQFGNLEICPNFANPYLTQFSSISGGNCIMTASTTTNNNNNTSHNNRRSVGLKKYTHQWLLVAMDHKTRDSEQKHIAALQHKKRTESQGWLQRMEAHQVKTHQHLSEVEKKKAMDLLLACKPHDSAIPLVAFASGVNATTMRCIYKKMLQSPTSSVFDCCFRPRLPLPSHATTTVRKRKTTTKTTIKNFATKNLMWRRS